MTRIQFPDRQPAAEKAKPARKPMRRVSKRMAAIKYATDPERKAFVKAVGVCMACQKRPANQCHEVARGNAREDALYEPRLQMALCPRCHADMDDAILWPPEKQLSRRILWEIEQTCRLYNEVRGTAPTHVTADDVISRLMTRKRPKRK